MNQSLEDTLRAERVQLQLKLQESQIYRRLRVVEHALAELEALQEGRASGGVLINGEPIRPKPTRTASSIQQAALFALEDAGHPIPTRVLVTEIERYGRAMRAKNPIWGLSNALSTDARFQSVPWQGARAWWFAGREVPEEAA